jgi:hypothetical protein
MTIWIITEDSSYEVDSGSKQATIILHVFLMG